MPRDNRNELWLKKYGILGAFKIAIMNSYTNIDGLPKETMKNTYNQSNGKTGLSKMLPIVVMVATLGKSIKVIFIRLYFLYCYFVKLSIISSLTMDQVLFA